MLNFVFMLELISRAKGSRLQSFSPSSLTFFNANKCFSKIWKFDDVLKFLPFCRDVDIFRICFVSKNGSKKEEGQIQLQLHGVLGVFLNCFDYLIV